MPEKTQNVAAVIRKAIEVEKNGLKTYLQFARETQDISGKNMFILLASDEFDHMNLLEEMLKEVLHSSNAVLPENVDLTTIEKIVPKLQQKNLSTVGKAAQDELMALKTARKMEKNAIEYYENLYNQLEDQKLKKLVRRLIEMEEGHYNIIQMEIDSVTNTGFWFNFMEFNLDM